jgi:hypothetical protein
MNCDILVVKHRIDHHHPCSSCNNIRRLAPSLSHIETIVEPPPPSISIFGRHPSSTCNLSYEERSSIIALHSVNHTHQSSIYWQHHETQVIWTLYQYHRHISWIRLFLIISPVSLYIMSSIDHHHPILSCSLYHYSHPWRLLHLSNIQLSSSDMYYSITGYCSHHIRIHHHRESTLASQRYDIDIDNDREMEIQENINAHGPYRCYDDDIDVISYCIMNDKHWDLIWAYPFYITYTEFSCCIIRQHARSMYSCTSKSWTHDYILIYNNHICIYSLCFSTMTNEQLLSMVGIILPFVINSWFALPLSCQGHESNRGYLCYSNGQWAELDLIVA